MKVCSNLPFAFKMRPLHQHRCLILAIILMSTWYTFNYFYGQTENEVVVEYKLLTLGPTNINLNILEQVLNSYDAQNEGNCTVIVQTNCSMLMNDTNLVEAVRTMLQPPSTAPTLFNTLEYLEIGFNPSAGQVQLIEDILKSFGNNGFFIECGANDGEWYSNTIWLERTLGWEGLLIEADPPAFTKLLGKNRHAILGHFCLSKATFPQKLPFYSEAGVMGSLKYRRKHHFHPPVYVPCVPLYTVLLAINRTVIDFFSLDIEGSELEVLRTVPFDQVIFKVITVEYIFIPEGKLALKEFMESKGYVFYKEFIHPRGLAGDSIYLHHSISIPQTQGLSMS